MVKISMEVKDDEKITKFSADLGEPEKAIRTVADKIESFLKKTFKVETFTKTETKQKE